MTRLAVCCVLVVTILILLTPGAAAAADSRQAAFAKSQATWKQLKATCGGNYSYKVRFSSWVGFGHETEIVCRQGKVAERKYRDWKGGPRLVRPGGAPQPKPAGTSWTETGDKIGSHKQGAPARTLDEMYQEAGKVLAAKLEAHQKLYVRYDKQGLLNSCFWVDTRIADDAPRTGVMIGSIVLGKPSGGGAKASGGRAINLGIADSGKTVKAGVGDLVLIKLASNPTTGFSWSAADLPKGSAVTLQSKKYLSASQMNAEIRPMAGQGGQATFTYRVAKAGKATISLTYRRPWEKKAKPARTFTVTIEASAAQAGGPVVTGTIKFSAPPEAKKISRIVVSIRNTALADGPAPLIGTVELKPPFKLPVTFAVPYDPAKVRPNPMFYSISARVYTTADGREKLTYINDTRHNIFRTPGDTRRDIAVKKLR